MFSYALKRVTRSTWLFAALFLGVILASTFFAGINVGADTTAKAALDQQLDQVVVDLTASVGFWLPTVSAVSLSSANWLVAAERVASVDGVVSSEVITRVSTQSNVRFEGFPPVMIIDDDYIPFTTVGLVEGSRVYDGLEVVSGASSLQENETYVWIGSEDVDEIEIGDVLPSNYTFSGSGSEPENVSLSLTVVGFVSLDEEALAISSGMYYSRNMYLSVPRMDYIGSINSNLLIADWEKTFAKILDKVHSSNAMYSSFNTEILAFIDRETVINPWSVDASMEAVNRIMLQIDTKLAEFGLITSSYLEYIFWDYQSLSMSMRLSFLVVAVPVFFVAWYVGSTVSEVSFNLRRREIGLLSAKGFSSGQLLRLFLSESLLIGILGGLIGIGLSFVLSPFFIPSLGPEFGGVSPVLTFELILLVLVFSTGLALLSTFRSSRRSAKLPTMDALREHLYVEETKVYKQKWALVALFLGSYKIGMTLIGIPSLAQYFSGNPPMTSNIFLTILFGVWMVIDTVITPVASLLFFWGFTKTLIRGSKGFEKLVSAFSSFLGDIGALAKRNVKRNPVRAASVAFLVALIIGYSFQTVGTLASEEDYIVREVNADVGADISVSLDSVDNATEVMNNITNLQGVSSATLEYSLSGQVSSIYLSITAVEPQEWLSIAYYENEWFSGKSVSEAFQEMATDNNTIILARGTANNLDLQINDYITVTFDNVTAKLRVVGFFGSASSMSYSSSPFSFISSIESQGWSYVPHGIYNPTVMSATGKVLVKLEPGVNATQSAVQIRDLDLEDVAYVYSVSEQLESREVNLNLSGTINVQRIGVIFAVVAASVATSLVALVGLQERKKEVAIMNIRGLSFKQVSTMLLTESLSVAIFSTVIGCVVGMITVYGNVVAANTETFASLVSHRMVFPPDAILTLAVVLLLVFMSAILPAILITRRYVSKLERIVRS